MPPHFFCAVTRSTPLEKSINQSIMIGNLFVHPPLRQMRFDRAGVHVVRQAVRAINLATDRTVHVVPGFVLREEKHSASVEYAKIFRGFEIYDF